MDNQYHYYRPENDRLLYLKLKEYLRENGSIPDNKEFHKPKKDGSDGPIVKTVKVYAWDDFTNLSPYSARLCLPE